MIGMNKTIAFPIKLTKEEAENKIREFVIDKSKIILTNHAIERMEERGFVMKDLTEILQFGYIEKDGVYDEKSNNYKYKIIHKVDTVRTAGVVTAFVDSFDRLVIITIEWEIYR